mmetsp:Transcript_81382/g.161858  ORF Transcript_81382/g.161858 Transcript_81382/m.161858 type:complete len:220 (-) Transcript_81382:118-777(-)
MQVYVYRSRSQSLSPSIQPRSKLPSACCSHQATSCPRTSPTMRSSSLLAGRRANVSGSDGGLAELDRLLASGVLSRALTSGDLPRALTTAALRSPIGSSPDCSLQGGCFCPDDGDITACAPHASLLALRNAFFAPFCMSDGLPRKTLLTRVLTPSGVHRNARLTSAFALSRFRMRGALSARQRTLQDVKWIIVQLLGWTMDTIVKLDISKQSIAREAAR